MWTHCPSPFMPSVTSLFNISSIIHQNKHHDRFQEIVYTVLQNRTEIILIEPLPSFLHVRVIQVSNCVMCNRNTGSSKLESFSWSILPYSDKHDKRKQLLKVKCFVNEQNVFVMYIDINAISLCLDFNIFQQDECFCSKLGSGSRTCY